MNIWTFVFGAIVGFIVCLVIWIIDFTAQEKKKEQEQKESAKKKSNVGEILVSYTQNKSDAAMRAEIAQLNDRIKMLKEELSHTVYENEQREKQREKEFEQQKKHLEQDFSARCSKVLQESDVRIKKEQSDYHHHLQRMAQEIYDLKEKLDSTEKQKIELEKREDEQKIKIDSLQTEMNNMITHFKHRMEEERRHRDQIGTQMMNKDKELQELKTKIKELLKL